MDHAEERQLVGGATLGMNALWWWIDRWRKSTAYTDMTLEEQGAYRNLLDEATLRGGALPNDQRILAKASGDATAWRRVRSAVMRRFTEREDGLHNETLDDVLHQSERRREKQARYRGKSGNDGGNSSGNRSGITAGNEAGNKPGSPDPDLSTKLPPTPLAGGRLTRREIAQAKKDLSDFIASQPRYQGPIYSRPKDFPEAKRCPHEPECDDAEVCVTLLALARRAKVATVITTFGVRSES